MFKYINTFTLRPKDLLIYAAVFLGIDIIIFLFSGTSTSIWMSFLILGLFEAFRPSSNAYLNSNDDSEESTY